MIISNGLFFWAEGLLETEQGKVCWSPQTLFVGLHWVCGLLLLDYFVKLLNWKLKVLIFGSEVWNHVKLCIEFIWLWYWSKGRSFRNCRYSFFSVGLFFSAKGLSEIDSLAHIGALEGRFEQHMMSGSTSWWIESLISPNLPIYQQCGCANTQSGPFLTWF